MTELDTSAYTPASEDSEENHRPTGSRKPENCPHNTVMHFTDDNRFQCTVCAKNLTEQYRKRYNL